MQSYLFAALLIATASLSSYAQQPSATPSPQPSAAEKEEQEAVKVYTEEVILPIIAYDSYGHFDPTLEPDDILVLEDGKQQQVRSVRHVPANILLVFDIGGQISGAGGVSATREIAMRIIASLRERDQLAVIQNSTRIEALSDWTTDTGAVARIIKTQLFSSNRSRLSQCLIAAADKLKERPVGNTHVIIFTDGLESQNDETRYEGAVKRIVATQATVHVITYSGLARTVIKSRNSNLMDMDFEMRRWRRKYAEATSRNDVRLAALVQEMGGRLLIPTNEQEIIKQGDEVAHDIGAQYVVTYAPRRPFAASSERRRISVSPRRVGLQLLAMRSYVAPPNEVSK